MTLYELVRIISRTDQMLKIYTNDEYDPPKISYSGKLYDMTVNNRLLQLEVDHFSVREDVIHIYVQEEYT